jgi:transcriptional regulator GlxA family with amidase domain
VREVVNRSALVLANQRSLLLQLIAEMRFNLCGMDHDREQRARVETAQTRLIETLARPLNLQTLADELNVSLRQLQRDFAALTGMSPVRYRNVIRLSEANALLAENSLPIAEIAANLGYASVAHFGAAFHQMYHCSPRDVRESVHKDADDGAGIDPLHSGVELEPAEIT